MPKARAVELLSQYSGYSKVQIYNIVKNLTKGAQNELISEKQPIKIELEKLSHLRQKELILSLFQKNRARKRGKVYVNVLGFLRQYPHSVFVTSSYPSARYLVSSSLDSA